MSPFQILLIVFFLIMTGYTIATVANEGPNLFPAFFSALEGMGWQGQFNLDFFLFLVIVGLWIAWRHSFRPVGILLGLCITGGMIFLSAYLLVISFQTNGDMRAMLLGNHLQKD